MSSVTLETASSASFQDTRSKPSRDDQRSKSDSFASLVDSNTAAENANSRQAPAPSGPPAQHRRADDKPATADSRPQRDDNRSDASSAAADARGRNDDRADANADASADAKADAKASSDTASKTSKPESDNSKQDKKDAAAQADSTSGTTIAADSPQPDAAATVAVSVALTPVALAIPVPIDAKNFAVVPAATGNNEGATAPLAIAAAAVLKAQQAAAGEAGLVPTDQTEAQTAAQKDAAAQTDQAVAAAIAAATPAVAKTTLKTTATAASTEGGAATKTGVKPGTAKPGTVDPTTGAPAQSQATDTAATVQHPTVKGEAKHDDAPADALKTDAAGTNVPSAAPAAAPSHDHDIATAAQAGSFDPGQQGINTAPQQQLQPALAAPIPVAQLTATAATDVAVPLSGLAVEIATTVQSGKSRFDIRLDPAELGRIDVRLDVDRHGQVTSHVTVEKPETLAMLRQDAPQLQRALEDAGLKTGDGGLQFSLRDQSSSGQNNGNESGRHAQRLVISEEDAIPAVTAQRSYGRMLGSNSGVDIRI